jgi:predicted transport protein
LDARTQFGSMPETLEQTTGRSLDEWLEIARGLGVDKHGQILSVLKSHHGLTHGYANMIALLTTGYGTAGEDELIAGQFAGPKAALRPIYDRVVEVVTKLGPDVEIAPKKSMVTFRRSKMLACFTPSSAKRAELGIALRGDPPTDRLRASNGMTSHAVWLASVDDVDDELVGWLREAYGRS